jgi:hypothetical protein
MDTLGLTGQTAGQQHWRYAGRAHSQGRAVLQRWKQVTPIAGAIQQTTDPHGRISATETTATLGAN